MNSSERIVVAPSLLTHEESDAIKGLLIILVVLGHNSVLMEATGLFPHLYSFHVYCFFILPYLYGLSVKGPDGTWFQTMRKLLPRWGKYYTVYLVMTILCTGVAYVSHHINFNALGLLQAFLTGSEWLLKQYAGFHMLWFLPTLCAVLFWHSVYFHLPANARVLLTILCCVLWILAAFGITNYHRIGVFAPFALMTGMYHCLTGCVSRYLACRIPTNKITRFAAALSFLFIPFFVSFRSSIPFKGYYLSKLLCPIVAILVFYQFRQVFVKSHVLKKIGELSFPIYLSHIFIYNLLLLACPNAKWQLGLAFFFVTIFFSYYFSIISKKIPIIRQLI